MTPAEHDRILLQRCPVEHRQELERYLQRRSGNATRGRVAQRAGESLEEWLGDQHTLALRVGWLARMSHVGPPIKHVREHGGAVVVKVVGPGPADYQGQMADGRSVAVEAKSRTDRLRRDDLTLYQQADLTACARAGGLALLVYEYRSGLSVTRYAIPWPEVPWRQTRKGVCETVGPQECAAWVACEGIYLERWVVPCRS